MKILRFGKSIFIPHASKNHPKVHVWFLWFLKPEQSLQTSNAEESELLSHTHSTEAIRTESTYW